jgi:hypothetical protein
MHVTEQDTHITQITSTGGYYYENHEKDQKDRF